MTERAIIEYAINALWQVPLLAGSAWLLLRMVRPAPVTQHRVWLAVLGLAVLLPVHGMGSGEVSATQHAGTVIEAGRDKALVLPAQNDLPRTPRQRFAFAALFSARRGSVRLTTRTVHWLLRLYVATIVIGLFRITRAWFAARTLVENSQEIRLSDRDRTALEDYSHRLGIRPPQLRQTEEVSSPMVVGGRAPVLLLPEGFARHTENEIRAALCHELAHIQRRDYLVNVVCQVAALPLAWHPVVDWVQQRIHMTREMVCDAMAAQEMKSHLGYAKCLLALAHSMLGERGMAAQAQFLGLFGNHTLEERVMRLMDTTTMSLRAKTARVVSGAAMMIASGVIAGMFHLTPAMAQADVLPQATQNPPEVAQVAVPEPKATSPAPATPGDTAPATGKKRTSSHRNGGDGNRQEPAMAEQPCIDKDVQQPMDDFASEIAKETANINSPEFKQQMDDIQRQMAEVGPKLNSPEFKKQMDDIQRQMAEVWPKLNGPEFKQQMDDIQRQMAEVGPKLNSPEFKQRMDDLARQMADETAKFNSPEFKKRMDDLQKQMQQQMEEFSRKYQRSPNP
jgi:beta-lactamase regulating signal transducer with metallopeptidase domain/polyhydroxyalkanoate synthesis regulator phasin